jgi:putative SOS response-associated peptidase YedK
MAEHESPAFKVQRQESPETFFSIYHHGRAKVFALSFTAGRAHAAHSADTQPAAMHSGQPRPASPADSRPLFAFAGIWTEFRGDQGTKSKPIPGPHLVYGFLTTAPNAIVEPIHPNARQIRDPWNDPCL